TLLNALSTIGGAGGTVSVAANVVAPSAGNTGSIVYTFTFGGGFSGFNLPAITATSTGATKIQGSVATVPVAATITTNGKGGTTVQNGAALELQSNTSEVQTVTVSGGTGTFGIGFNGQPPSATLNYTGATVSGAPTALAVQNALNALTSISGV